jgi:competence protein ComEC
MSPLSSPKEQHPAFLPGGTFARPGMLAALSLVAGSVLGLSIPIECFFLPVLIGIISLIGILVFYSKPTTLAICFCGVFFSFSATRQSFLCEIDEFNAQRIDRFVQSEDKLATVEGTVLEFPRQTKWGWNFVLGKNISLGAQGKRLEAQTTIAIRQSSSPATDEIMSHVVPGDQLRTMGLPMELPHTTTYGERNDWLLAKGAPLLLKGRKVEMLSQTKDRSLYQKFLATSLWFGNSTAVSISNTLEEKESGILKALLLGRTSNLDQWQREAFRRAGLMHLFAISGLHTMLIGGLMLWFLRLFGMKPHWRLCLLMIGLFFFAALVGLRPSVLRACLLLLAFESQELLRRPIEPLAALGSIASILMLFNPRLLWQIDFQMSFLCATVIVLISPWMYELQQIMGRKLGWGWKGTVLIRTVQVFFASAAIQLMLAPIMLRTFGEVSMIAPISNVLLLGLVALIVKFGFFCLVLSLAIPALGFAGIGALSSPLMLVDWIAETLASFPFAAISGGSLPIFYTMAFYLLVFISPWFKYRGRTMPKRRHWQFAPSMLAMGLLVSALPLFHSQSNQLEVTFLDVGQGDAILIRTPDNRAILVDAGPDSCAPFLPRMIRERGVKELDTVILTHCDADHLGGMAELFEEMPPTRLITNGNMTTTLEYQELVHEVYKQHIPVYKASRGNSLLDEESRVILRVLNPEKETILDIKDQNETSLVLYLEYAGKSFLLTGDAETKAELEMIKDQLPIDCDILKAGHHGSKHSTSSLFLQATTPDLVIFSAGKGNRYRHPAEETLNRLRTEKIPSLRTDQDGSITITVSSFGDLHWTATRRED